MFQEKENKNNLLTQIICDSQGCRKVDLFGRPVKSTNDTLKLFEKDNSLKIKKL